MNHAAQINFVSSLFSSKIFLAQAVTLLAMILSAAGYHVIDAPGQQEQLIGILDAIATVFLRWLFPSGPVSVTGPISTPASQSVPSGTSVVSVPAAADAVQVTVVQPLPVGTHTVDVTTPLPAETPVT